VIGKDFHVSELEIKMKKNILFGAGKIGQVFSEKMTNDQKMNMLFCDNNANKIGFILNNIRIIAFQEMIRLYKNNEITKIVITSSCVYEIADQCCQAGISSDALYFFDINSDALRPARERYADIVYSQDGEEVYLKSRFAGKERGIYVDVGAHHPFRFSNTYWAYERGWRGINIEPDLRNYRLLKQYRKEDINLNCGISDEETQLEYYIFHESALNTFCEEEIRNKTDIAETRMVPVRRLDAIFKEYYIKNIDYIDIDVEGMEMRVLSSINWSAVSIDCILVEQREIMLTEVAASEVCIFLKGRGYLPVNKYNRTVIYEKVFR